MITLEEALRRGSRRLRKAGVESPRLDAEILLGHCLQCSRNEILLSLHREIPEEDFERFQDLISRRKGREPVAYIVGTKEFMSLSFQVEPHVLIPRPETEFLVQAVMERTSAGYRAWELGTGSGCVAISLAYYSQPEKILATDISPRALEIAKNNARKNGVEEKIEFRQGNLFHPAPSRESFDCLVMNPPYISRDEEDQLSPEVGFEPDLALYASHEGLFFYERIARQGGAFLRSGGFVALELGGQEEMAESVSSIFESQEGFTVQEIIPDYAEIPRVIIAGKL